MSLSAIEFNCCNLQQVQTEGTWTPYSRDQICCSNLAIDDQTKRRWFLMQGLIGLPCHWTITVHQKMALMPWVCITTDPCSIAVFWSTGMLDWREIMITPMSHHHGASKDGNAMLCHCECTWCVGSTITGWAAIAEACIWAWGEGSWEERLHNTRLFSSRRGRRGTSCCCGRRQSIRASPAPLGQPAPL